MPHDLTKAIFESQVAIILFEDISGEKQVFSIAAPSQNGYTSFSLVNDEDYDDEPVGMTKINLSTENAETWLKEHKGWHEKITPMKVNFIESSFLTEGRLKTVIEGIDIFGRDGKILKMRRKGAMYPNGLVLTVINKELEFCEPYEKIL